MEIDQHIAALAADGEAMSRAAQDAGLRAAVPGCPGWRVAELLRHTGYVHRWAARNILESPATDIGRATEEQIIGATDPPEPELPAWFRQGYQALARTLRTADPDGDYPFFLRGSPSPLAFWARRQAHETAIHRADAQLAAGQRPLFGTEFAADGIDELIMGFAARSRRGPPGTEGRSLLVHATDAAAAWRITWPAEPGIRPACERTDPAAGAGPGAGGAGAVGADADCQLAGPAAGLYLLLWNRADAASAAVTITGDEQVANAWRDGFHVRW